MNVPLPLVPWSSPVDGAPGWKILVPGRNSAGTLAAVAGGEVQAADDGRWPVIIRRASLDVVALDADDETVTVALPACDALLAVRRRKWADLETLACADRLPADGVLTVRQFIVEDPAGQLLQALVPVFAAAGCGLGIAS